MPGHACWRDSLTRFCYFGGCVLVVGVIYMYLTSSKCRLRKKWAILLDKGDIALDKDDCFFVLFCDVPQV